MYRKYNLLTGLTCKPRYVPLVSEITPVKLSHIVFPVTLGNFDLKFGQLFAAARRIGSM